MSRKAGNDPDWLPDPDIDFRALCFVTLIFFDPGKGNTKKNKIHVDTRTAHIEGREVAANEFRFDIHLDEPFSIEVDKIYETVARGSNGTRRWKRTIPTHYQLDVEIKCQDPQDSIDFLSLMEEKSPKVYQQSLTAKDAILRANWHDLPECPGPHTLLKMTRTNGPDYEIESNYGVGLSIGWSPKRDSPLTTYTKARRAAIVPEQDQLPTPSASDESEKATKQHVITYIFMNERYLIQENLRCPLCAAATNAHALHEYASFDQLHFHLLMWHDHFHPKVVEEKDSDACHRKVYLWFSGRQPERFSQPVDEDDEEEWIAPNRPFDQKAYLRGEDSWTGHPRLPSPTRHGPKPARPPTRSLKKHASSTSISQLSGKSRSRPSEVRDMPDLPKPRYRVPKVPGIRFYRTKSKRPFEEDEEVSESDEEVDESWLRARLHDDMQSLPISAGETEFIRDWNYAANEENFSANVLTREGVVRFTRFFQAKLQGRRYCEAFTAFLARLKAHGVLDDAVFDYCTERIQAVSDLDSDEFRRLKHPRLENAASRREMAPAVSAKNRLAQRGGINGNLDRGKGSLNESAPQGPKICTCGKPVSSARGSIICHDNVSFFFFLKVSRGLRANNFATALLPRSLPHGLRRAHDPSRRVAVCRLLSSRPIVPNYGR